MSSVISDSFGSKECSQIYADDRDPTNESLSRRRRRMILNSSLPQMGGLFSGDRLQHDEIYERTSASDSMLMRRNSLWCRLITARGESRRENPAMVPYPVWL